MKSFRLWLLLALFCAGCGNNAQKKAEDRLRNGGAEKLRQDAAVLYKDTFSSHGTDFVVIRPRDWPPSFLPFNPVRVGAYPDGISIALQTGHRDELENGLYIVPKSMDHEPRGVGGTVFQKLADGIYWYSFGD